MSDPTREEVDQMPGPVLLEFGAPWCGHCQAIQPQLTALLKQYPDIRHINIHDGPGRRLGRSFRVKLWPTLLFLRDGQIIRREVRPSSEELTAAFEELMKK